MTFHAVRTKAAKGAIRANKDGTATARIVATLPEDDMVCLTWWADKKGVPVATVLRNAVWAYLQCVRADFERERDASRTDSTEAA